MGGDFHAWDLIPAIIAAAGPSALHIATLGFNLSNNAHLCELLDSGQVPSALMLCSSYFAKTSPETYAAARTRLTARGAGLRHTRTHAKVFLLRAPAAAFTIEASANLRSCNNLEQITIFNDPELYAFHANWIEKAYNTAADT